MMVTVTVMVMMMVTVKLHQEGVLHFQLYVNGDIDKVSDNGEPATGRASFQVQADL